MSLDLTPAEVSIGSAETPAVPLSRRGLWVMAAACGAMAANVYYNQPLLSDFGRYFAAKPERAALVATAAQVGYGTGIFFLVPLGDLVERRRLILVMTGALAALLVGMAAAPTLGVLVGLQVLVGAAACGSQVLIPLGIDLTPPDRRGKTVGTLMAGLLCGILLARTVAGFLGTTVGWRATYAMAAGIMAVAGAVLWAELPHRRPTLTMRYPRLIGSMLELGRTQPTLWTASAVSGLSFAGFTAFWTALSFLMTDHFHAGPARPACSAWSASSARPGTAGRPAERPAGARGVTVSLSLPGRRSRSPSCGRGCRSRG